MTRPAFAVAAVLTVCGAAACSGKPAPPPAPAPSSVPAGAVSLDCSDPIAIEPSVATPYSSTLDAVALDTTSLMEAGPAGGTGPYGFFVKTALLVHAGRESAVTVPAAWAAHASVAWGNGPSAWTTGLHVPACPPPSYGTGSWLVFPGGISLDKGACVPLEISTASTKTTVYVAAGARCRD